MSSESVPAGNFGAWLPICGHVFFLELKHVENLLPVHLAQVLTYLKLTDLKTGLLVNFNVPSLKLGLRRLTRRR